MHSEASIQDREKTQNHTSEGLDVLSLQKRVFQCLKGSHLGKGLWLFFVALRRRDWKQQSWWRNFSSIKAKAYQKKKGKSFLSTAIQRQSRQCEETESQFMQRVDNHLAEMLREEFKQWFNVQDQVSVSLSVFRVQTELEPPEIIIKQKIKGLQETMRSLGPLFWFHDSEGESAGICILTGSPDDCDVHSRLRTKLGDCWSFIHHLFSNNTWALQVVSLFWSFIFVNISLVSLIPSFTLLKVYPPF